MQAGRPSKMLSSLLYQGFLRLGLNVLAQPGLIRVHLMKRNGNFKCQIIIAVVITFTFLLKSSKNLFIQVPFDFR